MKKSKFVLALLILLSVRTSFAEESCTLVDLSDEVGPVRNQGDSNNCYANTAADLLTQKLRKTNPRDFGNAQVSAMDVTYQYFQNSPLPENPVQYNTPYPADRVDWREAQKLRIRHEDLVKHPAYDPDSPGGGYIDQAINAYKVSDLGVCTEAELPSDDDHVGRLSQATWTSFYASAAALGMKNEDSAEAVALQNRQWTETVEKTCHRKKLPFKKVLVQADGIDTAPSKDGTFNFVHTKNDGSVEDITPQVRRDLQRTVDAGLDSGSIVALDVTPTFLVDGFQKKRMMRQHARHAVSVVSRALVDNKCYYKIRNSWGQDCRQYSRKFADLCVSGYIWVQRADLVPHIFRAQYLQ